MRTIWYVAEEDPSKAEAIIGAIMAPNEKVEALATPRSEKLGHGQQGRPRERLVGLHDLDRDTQEALVSRRCVAAARRLPRSENSGADPRQKMERAACSGRGRRRRTSLVQEPKGRVSGIVAVKPEGDKASRMAVASAKFEAGQALLPERASWLADLEAELFVFPGSRHDDQCDSISQALLDKHPGPARLVPLALAERIC
jgi:predicted phage terminase large subunit-like protein